ncbi:MAG TPA: hypothetical protein ENN17_11345, partial [bacterium]|nr:hypothetical protein [bacterium]
MRCGTGKKTMSVPRHSLRLFLWSVLCGSLSLHAGWHVVRQHADSLEIRIDFSKPSVFARPQGPQDFYAEQREEIVVRTHGPQPGIAILSRISNKSELTREARPAGDIPMGSADFDRDPETAVLPPLEIIPLRREAGRTLWQILLRPVEPSSGGARLVWTSQMRILLTGPGLALNQDALIDPGRAWEKQAGALAKPAGTELFVPVIKPDAVRKKRLKIWIREEGLYRLTRDAIQNAGLDLRSVDPRMLRLTGNRGEIPIRISGEQDGRFDAEDYLEFWGEPLWEIQPNGEKRLDPFADLNVYFLETGESPGLRMAQEQGVPSYASHIRPSGRSFLYTIHDERDLLFNRLAWQLDLDEGDHWFYTSVNGGEKRQIEFEITNLDPYSIQLAQIRIHLRGQSAAFLPQPVEVFINDRLVISGNTIRNEKKTLQGEGFSPLFLKEGNNILTLVNRSSERELSQVFLDWFEISYPRLYQAVDDILKFTPPPFSEGRLVRFTIEGFTENRIDVYKIGRSHLFRPEITAYQDSLGEQRYRVVFQDEIGTAGQEYLAVAHTVKRHPDSLRMVVTPDLRTTVADADYVIITPHDSLGGTLLAPLLSVRKKQGLRCAVVTLDTLYDNFFAGIPHPAAIVRFLRHGYDTWNKPPRFCLLIGDGYFNMRRRDVKNNVMPFFHYQTYKYGAAASDHHFTLLDGDDDLPDLAVGRLPVRNRAELEAVIDKIVTYEESPPDPWKNRYLMIASDRQTGTFGQQSESFVRDVLPKSLDPGRLYLQGSLSSPFVGGTADL